MPRNTSNIIRDVQKSHGKNSKALLCDKTSINGMIYNSCGLETQRFADAQFDQCNLNQISVCFSGQWRILDKRF